LKDDFSSHHPIMMDGIVGSATKTPDLEGIKKDQEWFGMD